MTQIIQALADISPRYDVVFCDLWGCLHDGRAVYPAAVAALQKFRAGGGRVVLMTNAPRPNGFIQPGLEKMGLPRDAWDLIVSSGDAAQVALFDGIVGRRVYHLGPDKDAGFFTPPPAGYDAASIARVPLAEAEGIVCTGPFDELTETPETYRGTFLYAKAKGLKLLCANPDIVVDLGDKRIYCAGALADLYSEMGGESLYFGKPHPPIYDLARRRMAAEFGLTPANEAILAVGDGIATDIQGGIGEGIDTLFISGGIAAEAFGADPQNPDPAVLDHWLAARMLSPTAAMGRLR